MSMSQAHDSGRLLHWLKGAKRVRESATHRGAPAQLRARSSGTSPHGIADQPPGRAARIAPGVRLFERSADLRHVSLGLMSRLGRNGRDFQLIRALLLLVRAIWADKGSACLRATILSSLKRISRRRWR
jgi:hypothetical protein